jgi:copper chaperone
MSSKEIAMFKFSVPNMSCGHCTASIQKAIMAADPDATVSCDLTARIVDVDSTLDETALAAAISDAGYRSEKLAEVQ